ncbi:MAG: MoaD family protein, archaeal [uncultured archaeon A07HB70]|nr:MAG: MoaD family protein, archaeal [uncultured archaeon A07HB70]
MDVQLKFFATFREAVGSKLLDREVEAGATVGDLLEGLEHDYDGLSGELLVDGDLRPQINVLRNGREVLHQQGVDTPVDDGDTVAVFPPVAGGAGEADDSDPPPNTDLGTGRVRERSYRGISRRLAVHYLTGLGGEKSAENRVEGDGWTVNLEESTATVGPTLSLTQVDVRFEGDPASLDALVSRFSRKAMRAGG